MEDPAEDAREVARGMLGVGVFLLACGGLFVAGSYFFAHVTNYPIRLEIDWSKTRGTEKTLALTCATGLLIAFAGVLQFTVGLVYGLCNACRRMIGGRR